MKLKEWIPLRLIGLASKSRGRQELYNKARLNYIHLPPKVNEKEIIDEIEPKSPKNIVVELAKEKANNLFSAFKSLGADIVVASDTIVYDEEEDKIIGKPKNISEAIKTINYLNGRAHKIYSSVVVKLCEKKIFADYDVTKVWIARLEQKEIKQYIEKFKPFYYAGGYEVIGLSSFFVTKIEGNVTTVIGLPMHKLYTLIKKSGYNWFEFIKVN